VGQFELDGAAEAIPKAVQGATDLLDVGVRRVAAIFRVLHQLDHVSGV